MTGKRLLEIAIVSALAGLLGSGFGGWASGVSDAAWWQVLPWVLLVAFWAVLALQLWRKRAGRPNNGLQGTDPRA